VLDGTVEGGEMDLAADFSVPLPMLVIAEMLGTGAADLPRFKRWSDAILKMSYTIGGGGEEARAATEGFVAVTAEMDAYLAGLLAERRARPHGDPPGPPGAP